MTGDAREEDWRRSVAFGLNRQLIEVASWRVAAEILRRHPALGIIEAHRGDGTGDELALLRPGYGFDRGAIALNRGGSAHLRGFDDPSRGDELWSGFWLDYLTARDPREVVLELERRAGLTPPPAVPPSTRPVIVVRVIAAILAGSVFGRTKVECRNGMQDGGCTGRRDAFFAAFPRTRERAAAPEKDDWCDQPAYRFWFILRAEEPLLAFETATGLAWTRSGRQLDLRALWHASGRSIGAVAAEVGGDVVP